MKSISFILLAFSILICSCNKQDAQTQTFTGNLPIVNTSSPSMVVAGQDIVTNIRLELTSLSGSVEFREFIILAKSNHQYNITAKALYKDWNSQIGMAVMWTKDTTSVVKTTTPGTYILNFYNADNLFKSDTIQVN